MSSTIRNTAVIVFIGGIMMLSGCANDDSYFVQSSMESTSEEEKTSGFFSEITSESYSVAETDTEKTEACESDITDASDEIVFCNSLMNVLTESGHDAEELENSGQCIAVAAYGCSCDVYFFEKEANEWEVISETYGIVGKNGVSEKSREGDYRTPEGIYGLGFAFGMEKITGLSVEYRQITENSYWIDDPESELYNTWQETSDISWNSAEHLIDYPESYKYAVVIDYNMNPVVPGAGSAIFLHCADGSYTAGCVAVPEDKMLEIIKRLDKEKNPKIIIYSK